MRIELFLSQNEPRQDGHHRFLQAVVSTLLHRCLRQELDIDARVNGIPLSELPTWHPQTCWDQRLRAHDDIVARLRDADIVILDISFNHALIRPVTRRNIEVNCDRAQLPSPALDDDDIEFLNHDLRGLAFYHAYRDVLDGCQAVFLLDGFESQIRSSSSRQTKLISLLVDPLCGMTNWRPPTMKYANHGELDYLGDRLEAFARLHANGYTNFDNLADIEFAAAHDEPVMLVGESGTGKEYVARAIHVRWVQEKIRAGLLDGRADERFMAVNCANLSEALAEVKLFGALGGSYTDSADHALGWILSGCGVGLKGTRAVSRRPEDDLLARSDGLTRTHSGHITVSEQLQTPQHHPQSRAKPAERPLGTLFLDEFGDLPVAVQPKLLRYLDRWEVPILGLSGVITGARLRLITATSDPRFAAFAGYGGPDDRLMGQWRTHLDRGNVLRNDLLFRIKGQTVRVVPVTTQNVASTTRRLVAQSTHRNLWSEPAIKYFIDRLAQTISEVACVQQDVERGNSHKLLPVFGHKREISRTIRLLELAKLTAHRRGLRPQSAAIEPADIDALWRRAAVPNDHGPASTGTVASPTRSSDAERSVETAMREKIRRIFAEHRRALPERWTPEMIRSEYVNESLVSTFRQQIEEVLRLHEYVPKKGARRVIPDSYKRDLLLALGHDPIEVRERWGALWERVRTWPNARCTTAPTRPTGPRRGVFIAHVTPVSRRASHARRQTS